MILQNVIDIDAIQLDDDNKYYDPDMLDMGAKIIAETNGLCINPPILCHIGDMYSCTYRVVDGYYQVRCAKLAKECYGTETVSCYVAENDDELEVFMRQLYAFRYE